MKETKLYEKLKPHLLLWGECDRVENAIVSGMADVYYNIAGETGWIETKIAKSRTIFFEKFQLAWIGKHYRQGARIFVVVLDAKETIHFYPAGVILRATRTPNGKFVTINMDELPSVFNIMAPYKSWNSVKDVLTS